MRTLAAFQADPDGFDLVIADHTMPEMTGEHRAQELRRLCPDLPIILCTGFSHQINAEKAQALGIDAFMMKPVLAPDLAAVVERVLAQWAGQPPPRRQG